MNRLLTLAIWLLVAACQSTPEPTADSAMPEQAAAKLMAPDPEQEPDDTDVPDGLPNPDPVGEPTSRKLVRNAQLRFRVSEFTAAGQAIGQTVRDAGGQIIYANESRTGSTIENALVVRIPAGRLDAFVAEVLKQSIFTDAKTITTEDVTRRYVDIEARIHSKKITEETYLRLLKQARSVEDVLKVEEQLGQIREAREVNEAELRQLKNEVALSTVNLNYYQETEAALRPEEPFYTQIAHNLADGFRLVGTAFVSLFYLLPLGLLVVFIVWLVIRWRRKPKNPNQ